ncbi:MAG TPA: TIM barrel protein [Candidatus Limnocylindrales bacterium]
MIRVANAPCSWGVIEGIEGETAGWRQVVDEMSAAGFAGTELGDWGFMPTDPTELRRELDARGLALVGSWVSVNLEEPARLDQNLADAVRTAKQLARVGGPEAVVVLGNDPYGNPVRTRNVGRIAPEMGMTEAQWSSFVTGAEEIARRVRAEAGIRTVLHQHIGTYIETMEETRRFIDSTDPSLVGLVVDTGHWSFGGGDPAAAIRELRDRVWHVHFKEFDREVADATRTNCWDGPTAVGRGVFAELGTGSVDFPGVLRALEEIGYGGWIVVEQDVLPGMGTPGESARRNREYLRSIGL